MFVCHALGYVDTQILVSILIIVDITVRFEMMLNQQGVVWHCRWYCVTVVPANFGDVSGTKVNKGRLS